MPIDHKSQHARVKEAMANSGHEISYHTGGAMQESGSDFDRPGERYYATNPVSKERLESEYDRQPGGGYTHKAKRK